MQTIKIKDTDGKEIKLVANSDGNYSLPVKAELSGSTVSIGGKTYGLSGGDTVRGKATDRPTADAAHAVIAYCYYYSVDTGVVEVTDGASWVVM